MSNSDSFIDEVADAVRRDKLFAYIRRYGWIAVLCVLALVGGAAWTEYSAARARAAAEATGEALLGALAEDDSAARAEAIAAVTIEGPAAAVASLLTAATQQDAGDIAAAAATLDALATNPDAPQIYRELAAIKAAMLPSGDVAARRLSLEALAQPGQPFRLLALEQLAHLDLAGGDADAALATLKLIVEDAAVSRGLRERAQTLMVAMGEDMPAPEAQ